MEFAEYLVTIDACNDAVEWVDGRNLDTAWAECEQADWMMWLLGKHINVDGWPGHTDVVRLICQLVRMEALPHVPEGEDRPLKAIEAAEEWYNNPTEENGQKCRAAAHAAADASYAAHAAAYAAYAAHAAADAAAYAAHAAAYAADAAVHKRMCDYIRAHVALTNARRIGCSNQ